MKKSRFALCFALVLSLCISAFPSFTASAEESFMSISLRIEGINENIYYDTVEIPYNGSLNLKDAILYVDSKDEGLAVTGADTDYITTINGESASSFGGWDGWLFSINGVNASSAMSSCLLNENDKVVFYYGDPYGVGMQFPSVEVKDGKLIFTSKDTVYDENFNPSVKINPVVSATVSLNGKDFTTDQNGEISLDSVTFKDGANALQISKFADNGCPAVLRFAPDFTVELKSDSSETTEAPDSFKAPDESSEAQTEAPETGDSGVVLFSLLALVSALALSLLNRKNEA